MLSSSASKRTRASKADPTSDAAESPDRRALIYLLNFLLEGFERISSNGDPPASSPSERLDQWSNDDYMYIETRIPDDLSGLEMDLGLVNGVIFARIRRGEGPLPFTLSTMAANVATRSSLDGPRLACSPAGSDDDEGARSPMAGGSI